MRKLQMAMTTKNFFIQRVKIALNDQKQFEAFEKGLDKLLIEKPEFENKLRTLSMVDDIDEVLNIARDIAVNYGGGSKQPTKKIKTTPPKSIKTPTKTIENKDQTIRRAQLEKMTVEQLTNVMTKFNIKVDKGSGKNGAIVKKDRVEAILKSHDKMGTIKPNKKTSKKETSKKSTKTASKKTQKSTKTASKKTQKSTKTAKKEVKPKQSTPKREMREITFIFEYHRGKPIEIKYKIEKEDYETFYNIVSEFFTTEILEEKPLKQIMDQYPEYADKIMDDGEYNELSLKEIFDINFMVDGFENAKVKPFTYKISWST